MPLQKKCKHAREGIPPEKCGCAWYASVHVAGRRRYIPLGPDTRRAQREHERILAELARGEVPAATGGVPFGQAAQSWLELKLPRLAPNSRANYPHAINHAVLWLDPADVDAIEASHLTEMASTLLGAGKASRYVRLIVMHARAVLDHAHEQGWRNRPAPKLRRGVLPAVQNEPHVIAPPAMEEVLRRLDEPYRSLSEFTWLTGLRPSEAIAVQREDFEADVLHVKRSRIQATGAYGPTKGRRARAVALGPRALAAARRAAGAGTLWEMSYHTWLRRWHEALADAGLERCGLHTLRHSNVAARLVAGQTLPWVARQLGHASAAFTLEVYGRWIPSQRDEVAALEATVAHLASPQAAAPAGAAREATARGRAKRRALRG